MNFNVTISTLLLNIIAIVVCAQENISESSMIRLFEDNDFINIHFSGSDKAYTHGFRADLFFEQKEGKRAFAERLTLRAGHNTVETFGWGVTQLMFTPSDISNPVIAESDYRYACSISLLRTRHSSNPIKKYNLQTEYLIGVLGPASFGKETQDAMHRLINDEMPRGWNTQFRTAALINVNIAAEKHLFNIKKGFEYIGGAKTSIGTSLTGLSVYTILRMGRMNPYFDGYFSQYVQHGKKSRNWQLYAIVRPSVDIVIRNAHVQGGTFRAERRRTNLNGESPSIKSTRLNHFGYALDYGVVLTLKKMSITFTQRDLYGMIKGQPRHEVGNISIYAAL